MCRTLVLPPFYYPPGHKGLAGAPPSAAIKKAILNLRIAFLAFEFLYTHSLGSCLGGLLMLPSLLYYKYKNVNIYLVFFFKFFR